MKGLAAAVAAVGLILLTAPERLDAQGEGPRSYLLAPVGTNVLVPTFMDLLSNLNFAGDILINDAEVDAEIFALSYTRTFSLGERFAQIWVTPIWGSVGGEVILPAATLPVPSESGLADPYLAMRIGLLGTPALELPEFVQHRQEFQLHALLGLYVPLGDYESNRPLNLGTNRWGIRLGLPMVAPLGNPKKGTFLELVPSVTFFTDNTDPFGGADRREQDPLFIVESHLSTNLSQKVWGSIDLRYQNGGATTTDGVSDDNRLGQLGGGVTIGYNINPAVGIWLGYGEIIAQNDNSEGEMLRARLTWAF